VFLSEVRFDSVLRFMVIPHQDVCLFILDLLLLLK